MSLMIAVRTLDSAGIGELVACYKRAKEKDGTVKLLNPSGKVFDLLQLTKLEEVFELCDRVFELAEINQRIDANDRVILRVCLAKVIRQLCLGQLIVYLTTFCLIEHLGGQVDTDEAHGGRSQERTA